MSEMQFPNAVVELPKRHSGKELACQSGVSRNVGLIPGSGRSPGGGMETHCSILAPGKSHGQRSLVGYSPRGHKSWT